MPPRASAAEKGKGPAKRGAKRGADDALSLADLLARCTRADLEALLLEHEDDLPDLQKEVEARLQPEQRKKTKPVAEPVAGDAALVSTGPFSHLDAEVTLRILTLLSLKDRLCCVSTVCKGWRSLRRHPLLWRTLKLEGGAFSGSGLVDFVSGARSPLPSPACVETLELVGAKAFDAKHYKAVLKVLTSATSVTLAGKKLSKDAVVSTLTKGRAQPLRALKLGKMSDADAAVLEILSASPQLETLAFDGAVSDQWVDAAAARAASARGGGKPLLTSLTVGEHLGGWQSGVTPAAFGRLGPAFPELATLTAESLSGHFGPFTPALRTWAPMPALRSLTVNSVGASFSTRVVHDAPLRDFLKQLTTAAPGLRVLRFARGLEYLSHNELKAGRTFSALPSLGGPDLSGVATLQQLEELELQQLHLAAADVAGAHLPALRRLTLRNCGSSAAAAAAALAANAPQLASIAIWGLVRAGLDGEPGPGVSGLANLSSDTLQELQLHTSYGKDYMCERSKSVKEKSVDIATELASLARRKAVPALRALVVSVHPGTPFPTTAFEAAAPWPRLEVLELSGMPADHAAAMMATLRAPALRSLSLPGVVNGYALVPGVAASSYITCATPGVRAAYEKLRTDGHAPLLPPLRQRSADAPPPKAEAEEDEAGGAAGRDD